MRGGGVLRARLAISAPGPRRPPGGHCQSRATPLGYGGLDLGGGGRLLDAERHRGLEVLALFHGPLRLGTVKAHGNERVDVARLVARPLALRVKLVHHAGELLLFAPELLALPEKGGGGASA